MRRESRQATRDAARRLAESGMTLEQRIANNATAAAERALDQMPERTLPAVGPDVDLVTVTLPELHDLIYNATSTTLRDTTSMTKQARQVQAARIASQALLIVAGQDYTHKGSDPRG